MSPVSAIHSKIASAPALLAAEARLREGTVPSQLGGHAVPPGSMRLDGEAFILNTTTGYAFHYAKGRGVTMTRSAMADPAEQELWLNGSVYAAIAAIHGFMPFHASAVAWDGAVYAFSGPSGAGKSTLTAALGAHGLPLFCDDTLVLDISDPARVLCLPGHKRLKLTPQALALTGTRALEKVDPEIDKYYAEPLAGPVGEVLPLARLIFLEDGEGPVFAPIVGAGRVARINDDHYTTDLFVAARNDTLAQRFALVAELARTIVMERLVRPRDDASFAAVTAGIAAHIKERG
ncbi:hypothetical protein ACFFF7_10835 [Novosphingobium aquiterrae]|uniref:HPr kinase/phosphorylase C-terminal domain-containing protein n=1 Tax=Novosphingobium aquiterrae TaxID=624388 RepID=A0ABV6PJB6_9SPHN